MLGFKRHAGHSHQHMTWLFSLEPHHGGCPDAVLNHMCRRGHPGLTRSKLIQFQPAFFENFKNIFGNCRVLPQCPSEYFAKCGFCYVILCGAEPSGGKHHLAPLKRFIHSAGNGFLSVRNRLYPFHFPSIRGHGASQKSAVCVGHLTNEQFIAYYNYARFHPF